MSGRPYNIAMLGCGTVGSGVVEILGRKRGELEKILGRPVVLRRIAVRDLSRPRPAGLPTDLFTTDTGAVVDDPKVDVVVELIGGVQPAAGLIAHALYKGKDVVTANKAALAEEGETIFRALYDSPARLRYEAAVAGGIPIIKAMEEGLVAGNVTLVVGILNGTCNDILTRMEKGQDFAGALRDAQEAGFAEADPTLDVSGEDTAHKLSLLVTLMSRRLVPWGAISVEGIERVTADDIHWAARLGRRIKMLGIARVRGSEVEMRVHPTLVSRDFLLSGVSHEYNAIYVESDAAGPQLYYGKGAGGLPTASAVLSDVVDLARTHAQMGRKNIPVERDVGGFRAPADLVCRNYVRLLVPDKPGVIGRVASHLGERGISIATLRQPAPAENDGRTRVVLTTHPVRDASIAGALEHIEKAGIVLESPTRIRIEDFGDTGGSAP